MPRGYPALLRNSVYGALGAAVILLIAPLDAMAQEAPGDAVQVRPRPEYDPIGFELDQLFTEPAAMLVGRPTDEPGVPSGPLSSFEVFPKLALDVIHTDNLFRTPTDGRSDFIYVARPSVRVASNWDNHSLSFLAEGSIGRHRRTPLENYEDHKLEAAGQANVDEFDSMSMLVSGERSHEQRGEIDDPGSNFGPTFVDIYKLGLGYEHQVPDGFLVWPQFGVSRYRYENNGSIDNADRWRDDYDYTLRLGYEFVPGTTLFVQPRYTTSEYRQRFDRNGLIRDEQTIEFLTGVTWDASAVTFVDAGIGFLSARFDEPTSTDKTAPTANVRMTWNATSLVTVKSAISRNFSPTASAGIAGTLDTNFIASVDWEALYNVILGVEYGYTLEEFIDAVPAHSRAANQFSVSARWLINENFFADSGVTHDMRSGDVPGDSLKETRFIVTIGAQL